MMGDSELVACMLAGSQDGFEEFFGRFFPPLYRFALSRLDHNADLTEDMVQATLCRAIDRLRTYRNEAALLTWLFTLCRHEISDYWDRRRTECRVSVPEGAPESRAVLHSLASADSGRPDVALDRQELSRLVHATLDRLPARYGDALEWKYVDGLSVKEIADRLAIGPKAAESLLTRARLAFREGFPAVSEGVRRTRPAPRGGPDRRGAHV